MQRTRIQVAPAAKIIDFEDLYYEISHDWRHKAEALQVRRWRKLKQEVNGNMNVRNLIRHQGGAL